MSCYFADCNPALVEEGLFGAHFNLFAGMEEGKRDKLLRVCESVENLMDLSGSMIPSAPDLERSSKEPETDPEMVTSMPPLLSCDPILCSPFIICHFVSLSLCVPCLFHSTNSPY